MAHWPWADVLAAGLMLDEVERVDGLRARAEALEQAQFFAFALHDPGKLGEVARELERERLDLPEPTLGDVQERAEQVLDLVAFAERIARRKRRKRRTMP